MQAQALQRWGRGLLLVAAVAIFLAGTPVVTVFAHDAASRATLAYDNDKKTDREKNQGNDGDEDHVLRGQVLVINRDVDPPELQMADFDGKVIIKVIKTDEIDVQGVKPGDHIRADGEKIHEFLFEATQLTVTAKCCKKPNKNNS